MSAEIVILKDIRERPETGRQALFRAYNDLRRQAVDSEDFELHRLVGEAYVALMRSFLLPCERALLDAQDEIAALQSELAAWRRGERSIGRPM